MILSELQTEYLKDALAFLDAQKILHPSFNSQVGFDFQGFRRSSLRDPQRPESRSVPQFGRV